MIHFSTEEVAIRVILKNGEIIYEGSSPIPRQRWKRGAIPFP